MWFVAVISSILKRGHIHKKRVKKNGDVVDHFQAASQASIQQAGGCQQISCRHSVKQGV
jgi:hypothetical protein